MFTCEKIRCDPVELGCFKMDLEMICERKMNSTFEFPQCDCHNCLLPDDPTFDIWQDCIKYMSDFEKLKMRYNCYENIEHFKKDLIDDCYAKSGNNVTLPECGVKRMELMDHRDSPSSKCNVNY
ncbi:hypothetical protein LSH36_1016g00009 [Paralvinella palmiformis]|uniref:Uncharacterized protein n=1 Tax=Paralvinella palmiformis TaxID=53620 RepID=A0AAD9MT07_9ANNE|nr:hypothetical protein LSH36_1016g00009 [Paralvinella palmiformis]